MTRAQARALYASVLMDRIRADPFPSATHMTLVEQALPTIPELIPDYMEVLIEKVQAVDHPSIPMLHRLASVAEMFPMER